MAKMEEKLKYIESVSFKIINVIKLLYLQRNNFN